jgi:hypothetical protein
MADIQVNPLQAVFEGLATKNPQLKELGFESFQADMQDSAKLQSLYDGLSNKNPQLKERGFDGFRTDMFGGTQATHPEAERVTSYIPEVTGEGKQLLGSIPATNPGLSALHPEYFTPKISDSYQSEKTTVMPEGTGNRFKAIDEKQLEKDLGGAQIQQEKPLDMIDQLKVDYIEKSQGKQAAIKYENELRNPTSFGGEVVDQLQSGSESLLAATYGTPGYLYDYVASGFRGLGMDVDSWKDSWAQEAKIGNVDVNPLSFLEKQKNELLNMAAANDVQVKKANPDIDKGIIELFESGNVKGGFRNIFSSIAQSAPSTIAMIATGGMSTPAQIGLGALVFGSQNMNEADRTGNYGNTSRDAVLTISGITGAFESTFETLLGAGAVGKGIINLIKSEGKEAVEKELKKGISKSFAEMVIQNPWLAPFGESFEEMGTQLSQNIVNKYSGYKPDIKITDGVFDSGIVGFTMGTGFSGAIGGAKSLSKQNNNQNTQPSDNTGQLPASKPPKPASPSDPFGQLFSPPKPVSPRQQKQTDLSIQAATMAHKETGNVTTGELTTMEGIPNIPVYVVSDFMEPDPNDPGNLIQRSIVRRIDGELFDDGIEIKGAEASMIVARKETPQDEFIQAGLNDFDIEQEQQWMAGQTTMVTPEGKTLRRMPEPYRTNLSTEEGEAWVDETNHPVIVPFETVQAWEQQKHEEYLETIKPEVSMPETGVNESLTPSGDNGLKADPTEELFNQQKPELQVVPQKFGNTVINMAKGEGFHEVVPTKEMPLEKALAFLQNKFKDKQGQPPSDFVVVPEYETVTTPGKIIKAENDFEKDIIEPDTQKEVLKSVRIVPKTVIEQQKADKAQVDKDQKQAETEVLLDRLDEFNATSQSRMDKQKASEIEREAKRLGYMTDRNASNQLFIYDGANGRIERTRKPEIKPQITDKQKAYQIITGKPQLDATDLKQAELIPSEIATKAINGQMTAGEIQAYQKILITNNQKPQTNEKLNEQAPGIAAAGTNQQAENTPQAEQGQGNEEGLEENVVDTSAHRIFSGGSPVQFKQGLQANSKESVYRMTGLPQIQDIQANGVVRSKKGKIRGGRVNEVHWSEGADNLSYPATEGQYILEANNSDVNGLVGSLDANNLKAIWTFRNGKFENIKDEIISTGQPATVSKTADPVAEKPKAKAPVKPSNSITGKAKAVEVAESDIHGLALQYFINGGKVKSDEIFRMFRSGNGERSARFSYTSNENGLTVNQIAHNIEESLPESIQGNLGAMDVYNAVEKVIMEHSSPISMSKAQLKRYSADPNQGYSEEWLNNQLKIEEEERLAELEIWTNDLAQLEINGQLPTENELIELFLPENIEENGQEINQRGSIGENQPIDRKGNGKIGQDIQGSEPGVQGENESEVSSEVDLLDEALSKLSEQDFMNDLGESFGVDPGNAMKIIGLSKLKSPEENKKALQDYTKGAKKRYADKVKQRKQEAAEIKTNLIVDDIMRIGLEADAEMQKQIEESDKGEVVIPESGVKEPTEYKYHLTLRPFNIGTYPKENFVRYEDDGTNHGVLVYSEKVPARQIDHFSLSPITESEALNGKTVDVGGYEWVLELKKNRNDYNYFEAVQYDEGQEVDRMPLTSSEVISNIENGRWIVKEEKKAESVATPPLMDVLEAGKKAREIRQYKGLIYEDTVTKFKYTVTGSNSGYLTLEDVDTGKIKRVKEEGEEWLNNFVDVTHEAGQEAKGITSESSGVQNGTNYDVTQFEDNVFDVQQYGQKEAPVYHVTVGESFNLDNVTVTKDGKPLKKNENVPYDVLIAIQTHVEKFNPESKQREIDKFLKDGKKQSDRKNANFKNSNNDNGKANQARLDNERAMEGSAFDRLVGGSEAGSRIHKTIEASNNAGSSSAVLTTEEREELESRGINPDFDKNIFREILTKNAVENGVLLEQSYLNDKTLIHDKKANNTAENDVYLNQDKTTITKVNDLTYVFGVEKHNNLNGTIDRLLSHNSLFPNVAYTIKGFIINKEGKISLVMEQPFVEAERNATRTEIEEYLTGKGFKLDGARIWSNYSDVWSNGEYEIYDARPANVLKGNDGNLYFIDTFPHSVEYLKGEKQSTTLPEEKPAPVYGANNKIVSNERAEELRKRLRDKLNNLNSGFDPELLAIGTELAAYHIESGARKFADFSRRMIEDVGEAIKPYLKSIYNGARDIPGMEEIEVEMTEYSEVKKADIDQLLKQPDKATETGDKKAFVASIKSKLGVEKLNIVSIRKIAEENGFSDIKDTTLQEYVELAIISKAKDIVSQNISQAEKYRQIVELYNSQPTISMRSSERIEKQQYSTPLPMSFMAGEFVNAINPQSLLEPSAGNGMMVFNTDPNIVIANEIDVIRLENLNEQGFKEVTNQDGTTEFNIGEVDAIVTNPPFGRSDARDYKGYKISGLDEQMVVNALENLSETGRASIIIGGHTKYKSNGTLAGEKAFFNYLYNFYNVSDVINMDGALYSKQGTSYPTRLILINGRRTEINRVYAPLEKNTNTDIVTTFDELQNRVNNASNEKTILQPEVPERNGNGTGSRTGNGRPSTTERTGTLDFFGTNAGSNQSGNGQVGNDRPTNRPERTPEPNDGNGRDSELINGNERNNDPGNGGSDGRIQPKDTSKLLNGLDELAGNKVEIDLSKEKTPYPARSKSEQIGSVVPTNVAQTLADVLSVFKDIDEYTQVKLGYNSKDELFNALAAEQIDSVAMAIYQIENGGALIIGDMTGVGKGRQAAAILRYAHLQGKKPIFVTEKAHLFSDIYRDLRDIGSADLNPFIFNSKSQNSDPTIVDENGAVIYKPLSEAVKKSIFQGGIIPAQYDYTVLTYSQLNAAGSKLSIKKDFFSSIAEDNILVLDESHNAGGDGNTGTFMTETLPATKGVVFLSGTFAKRADNMPIYALKTAMSETNMSNLELIEAIKTGGVPLQEIMSKNLTQSGQMIRRERDFTGVSIDWKTIEDASTHFKAYDSIIKIFNDLIQFQREYIDPIIEEKNEELAAMQAGAEHTAGTSDFGINNVPFASKTFNLTRQLLFSLKANNIADEAIAELKAGRRPVIAVANTMEGFMNELGGIGEKISNYDFSTTLMKGLHGLFRFTETDGMGEHQNLILTVDDLPKDAKDRYYEIEDFIKNMSVGISISPIDVIKDRIQKAGYSIGEMTGRSNELIFNEDGTAQIQKRTNTDKKKLTRDFNAGKIDALIMNQSASTGISLHASEKVADQRQRVMLSAQTQLDVNTEVQMRGRIDRTGQVVRGAYRYILSPIPAEQRMTMMFKVKLKSLDANTTSSQKSKTNEIVIVDFLNKYGDKICVDHLKEDSELNEKLLDPMKFEGKSEADIESFVATEGAALKIAGRVALLPINEQQKFYDEITEKYNTLINYLNDTNSNDLEITTLPLKAETKEKVVVVQGKGGTNPFAQDSYREKVEIDVLKKPLKAEEIKHEIKKLTGGLEPSEYKDSLIEKIDNQKNDWIESEVKKSNDEYNRKHQDRINKANRIFFKQNIDDAEVLKQMLDNYLDESQRLHEVNISAKTTKLTRKADGIRRMFNMFPVGKVIMIPNTSDISTNTSYSEGVLMGYKIGAKMNPSTITAVFATLDSRRKIEVPLSKVDFLNASYAETMQMRHGIKTTLDNWDEKIPTRNRRTGYIITGNILQAFAGNEGQLIAYTDIDGNIKEGILLPENYKPNEQQMRVQIIKKLDEIRNGQPFTDVSGNVRIGRQNSGGYAIDVPLSKQSGGMYFLDAGLRDLVIGRDFRQMGGRMVGAISESNLESVLQYMSGKYNTSVNVDIAPAVRPRETPVTLTPVRQTPLEEVLNNGKQVIEIKKNQEQEPAKESTSSKLLPVEEFRHTQTNHQLWNVKINGRSDDYDKFSQIAKKHKPFTASKPWNRYSKGFLFNTKDDAIRFKNEVEGNNQVNFRIIGETGAGNLDLAEEATTRLDNLKVAREMEQAGKDAKTIRLSTGWERGADKLWKYEISDDIEIKKTVQEIENLPSTDGVYTEEIPLSDILDSKELFAAYPELNDYKITFYNYGSTDKTQSGGFDDPKAKVIGIAVNDDFRIKTALSANLFGNRPMAGNRNIPIAANDIASLKSVLLHEVQHIIQRNSGFGVGGNQETLWNNLVDSKLQEFNEKRWFETDDQAGRRQIAERHVAKDRGFEDNPEGAKFDYYRSLAGEVESRNVQTRMNFTHEQRRNTLLQETEDVAWEDQIILMDGLWVSNMQEESLSKEETQSIVDGLESGAIEKTKVFVGTPDEMAAEVAGLVSQKIYNEIKSGQIGGFELLGKVYINSVSTPLAIINTWVHEKAHAQVKKMFSSTEKLNQFYLNVFNSVGENEINSSIPKEYHNDSPEQRASEYIAYKVQEYGMTGEIDADPKIKEIVIKIFDKFTTRKNIENAAQSINLARNPKGRTNSHVGSSERSGLQEASGNSSGGQTNINPSLRQTTGGESGKGLNRTIPLSDYLAEGKRIVSEKKENLSLGDKPNDMAIPKEYYDQTRVQYERVKDSSPLKENEDYFVRLSLHPELDLGRKTSVHLSDYSTIKEAQEYYPDLEFIELQDGSIAEVLEGLAGYKLDADNLEDAIEEANTMLNKDANSTVFYDRIPVIYKGKLIDEIPDGFIFTPNSIVVNVGYDEMIKDAIEYNKITEAPKSKESPLLSKGDASISTKPNTILINGIPRPTLNSNGLLSSIKAGETPVTESTPYSYISYAKSFTDLLKSESFKLHGFSGLDIPTQRVMLHYMFSFGQNDKVLDSIIKFIPIDMMNVLIGKNITPKVLFHNISVFSELFSVNPNQPISITGESIRLGLINAITSVRTKIPTLDQVFPDQISSTASGTNMVNPSSFNHDVNIQNKNQINNTGNNGSFSPTDNNINFKRGNRNYPLSNVLADGKAETTLNKKTNSIINAAQAYVAKPSEPRTLKQKLQAFRDIVQEKDAPVWRWISALKAQGATINDEDNPFMLMKLAPGRMQALFDKFEKELINPMIEIGARIEKATGSKNWIEPYLIALHAPERNASKRAEELERWKNENFNLEKWIESENVQRGKLNAKKLTEDEIQEKIDEQHELGNYKTPKEVEAYRKQLEQKDYSGILPMNMDENGKVINEAFEKDPDALARQIVEDFESLVPAELVQQLKESRTLITDKILQNEVEANKISQKQADEYRERWEHYIPLRGWLNDASKQFVYNKANNGAGSMNKHAKGRGSMAESPLGYMYKMGYQSTNDKVQGEIKDALLRMAMANLDKDLDGMLEIKNAYFISTGELDQNNEEIWTATTVKPTKEQLESGSVVVKRYSGHTKNRAFYQAEEHEVLVDNSNGGTIAIVFDKLNPDLLEVAQSFNHANMMMRIAGGQANNAESLNNIIQFKVPWLNISLRDLTNLNKAMFTQFNLQFPVTNIPRDFFESNFDSYIVNGKPVSLKTNKQAVQAIDQYLRGKKDTTGLRSMVQAFYENGGTTGHTRTRTPEEYQKDILDKIKKLQKNGLKKGMGEISKEWVTRWNQRFEDGVRFSVFMNEIKAGKTPQQAAFRSRNATVDFNIRGKLSPVLGFMWGFFEVSATALAKTGDYMAGKGSSIGVSVKNKKIQQRAIKAAGFMMLLGFVDAFLNDLLLGDDDDENKYYNRSRWMRHNYINISFPGSKLYVPIPLPPGWRAFKGFGAVLYDYTIGQRGKLDIEDAAWQVVQNFVDGYSPVPVMQVYNSETKEWQFGSLVTPLIFKPFYEISKNVNYMGLPIAKKPFTTEQEELLANHSLSKENTGVAARYFADLAWKMGGGDTQYNFKFDKDKNRIEIHPIYDWNPSKISHVVQGYGGGTFTFFGNILTTVARAFNPDEEIDLKQAPFVNAILKKTGEARWETIKEYRSLAEDIKGMGVLSGEYMKRIIKREKNAKSKYINIEGSPYLQKYKTILEAADDEIKLKAQKVDYRTGEGEDAVIEKMKSTIEKINKLKKEYTKQ